MTATTVTRRRSAAATLAASPKRARRARAPATAGSPIRDFFERVVAGLAGQPEPKARPTASLPRFCVAKFWDADSTPPALAALSRLVGGALGPGSGGRTPEIEAGIVMASLMHDVAYYYGGGRAEKRAADERFGAQIPYFVARLDPAAVEGAKAAAAVDEAAVALGGGFPFKESYSWSYGLAPSRRGYTELAAGEAPKIQRVARQAFEQVVRQIADGTFELSPVLKSKLARVSPRYRAKIEASLTRLAGVLKAELESGRPPQIPGFEP